MYVRKIPFESTFDGAKVTCTMRPLSFIDAIAFQAIEVQPQSDSPEDKKRAKHLEELELFKAVAPKLPGYVENFSGVTDSDGQPVSIDEVCVTAYFAPLVVAMGSALVRASLPANPEKPPVASGS